MQPLKSWSNFFSQLFSEVSERNCKKQTISLRPYSVGSLLRNLWKFGVLFRLTLLSDLEDWKKNKRCHVPKKNGSFGIFSLEIQIGVFERPNLWSQTKSLVSKPNLWSQTENPYDLWDNTAVPKTNGTCLSPAKWSLTTTYSFFFLGNLKKKTSFWETDASSSRVSLILVENNC